MFRKDYYTCNPNLHFENSNEYILKNQLFIDL